MTLHENIYQLILPSGSTETERKTQRSYSAIQKITHQWLMMRVEMAKEMKVKKID